MDPLVVGLFNRPVVHFMTRSDVFKWWLKPVLWSAHMLPIFRQHDGVDTKSKNSSAFDKCSESLRKGRNILIFGEGFTDDTPLRGLKPIKKGPIRIGFTALESMNWSKKVYISAVGINYTDRNTLGSEVVILNSPNKICLNDYREQYEQNSNKTIHELTKEMETMMQNCVIYLSDKGNQHFLESIMKLNGMGFNSEEQHVQIPLLKRLNYSQKLAHWINKKTVENNEELLTLKVDLESYNKLLKRAKLTDRMVYLSEGKSRLHIGKEILLSLLLLPFAILGVFHGLIPYLLAKKLTEKLFKRSVFWGGVKLMLGQLFGTLYNLPILLYLNDTYFEGQTWISWIYFFVIPLLCLSAYHWVKLIQMIQLKRKLKKTDLSKFVEKRKELRARIEELVLI